MADDKKKIVIIDDEEDVVTYLATLLLDHDFLVESSTDSRKGLKLVESLEPDLVCLDILMPTETGVSLYRKIKTNPQLAGIPVIIISGVNCADEMSEDVPPPSGYLEKPVNQAQFIHMVRDLLS